MRRCKALNNSGQPCGMIPLIGEDFCLQHSKSAKGQRARLLAHHYEDRSGKYYKLSRILEKALRDKKASLAEKIRIMLKIYDEMDSLNSNEKGGKEELKGGKTNFF